MDDEFNSIIKDICIDCKVECIFEKTPNSIHYGKIVCPNCNRWIRWVQNPNKVNQRTKTSKHSIQQIMKYHNFEINPFCFLCLREMEQLGWNETLTIDHIQELDKGGEDKLPNLQILCSACHKLKNWCRLYINWHFKKEE